MTGSGSGADVAVVGLGAMGALSAWRLAARGAKVIGFERFRSGHDRGSSHGDTRIFRTAYFESPEYVPLLHRAKQMWRQLEEESGAELLTLTGGLAIGTPDGELVSGVLASAGQNNLPHRLLGAADMHRLYPQHRLEAGEVGVYEEEAGFLRPERSIAAAAARAEALGARLMPETEVTAVNTSADGVVIETSRGRYAADRALIAAGAWTSKLLPDLRLPLTVEGRFSRGLRSKIRPPLRPRAFQSSSVRSGMAAFATASRAPTAAASSSACTTKEWTPTPTPSTERLARPTCDRSANSLRTSFAA